VLSNGSRIVAVSMLVCLMFALVSPALATATEQTAVAEQTAEKSETKKAEKKADNKDEKKDDKNSAEECVDPQAADPSAFNTLEDIFLLGTGLVPPAESEVTQQIEWKEVD